ncbi:Transcription factor, MADS-box [Dillenia turbinata]|uniref:Transcription factor, MADS-box n=1 Tax=Dillenia turbinata TaxID=194707 RepID=A0AAN8UWU7_9MAGN
MVSRSPLRSSQSAAVLVSSTSSFAALWWAAPLSLIPCCYVPISVGFGIWMNTQHDGCRSSLTLSVLALCCSGFWDTEVNEEAIKFMVAEPYLYYLMGVEDHPGGFIFLGAISRGNLSSVMDFLKSKMVKLPKNSKGHYLAMQRRKKSLFKKASELSTLCGIDICKGRKSEDREKKLRKEKMLLDVCSAQIQSQSHSDFSSEMHGKDVPYDIENVYRPNDIILEDKECCSNLDESIVNLCFADFVAEEQDFWNIELAMV